MNIKQWLRKTCGTRFSGLLVAASLLTILVASTGASAGSQVQLTEMAGNQENAEIYGNNVVYEDRSGTYSRIRVMNLETGNVTELPNYEADQQRPDIYGNKVVYEDERDGAANIFLYNLETGEEKRITENSGDPISSQAKAYPRIYKNKVVYADYKNKNGGYDLYLYNLETDERKEVSVGTFTRYDPSIDGQWVAFTDYSGENGSTSTRETGEARVGGISFININTRETKSLNNLPVYQADAEVFSSNVVWEDKRNGQSNSDIFLYDIETGEEIQITDNPTDQFDPDMHGDKIVYSDWRNSKESVYMYNLGTDEETRVSKGDIRFHDPAIHGDVVVYEGFGEGPEGIDLYAYFLNEDDKQLDPDMGNVKGETIETGSTGGAGSSGNPKVIYLIPLTLGGIGVYLLRRK